MESLLDRVEIRCKVPENFSIKDNAIETIEYFAQIRANCKSGKRLIIFDLYELKSVTIDAIMYMIAMVFQEMYKSDNEIEFGITKPKHKKARKFINNCGLKRFLKKDDESCDDLNDYYMIETGFQADTQVAKDISHFSQKNNEEIDSKKMAIIYNMLIEMMNNSCEHAYSNNELEILKDLKGLWFVFIENADDKLKFTFMDTGIGIPKSIFKKKEGSVKDLELLFSPAIFEKSDSNESFVVQALKGEVKRANTKESNRGRGLPEIYGYYKDDHFISNLCIVSGNEICRFYDSNRTTPNFKKLNYELYGTLYYWEIKKDKVKI